MRMILKTIILIIVSCFYLQEAIAYDKAYNLKLSAEKRFPAADFHMISNTINVMVSYKDNKKIGFTFTNNEIISIPAYSGKPINSLISMNENGKIISSQLLEHHEPILLVGIPEVKLEQFVSEFSRFSVNDQIRIGSGDDKNTIDAITGATVTVMVVNEAIMKAANRVARHFNIAGLSDDLNQRAKINNNIFENKNWQQLVDDGSLSHLRILQKQVNAAFANTNAKDIHENDDENTEFIDLYFAILNIPTIGRNLLGDDEYEWLINEKLQSGDLAMAVMASGEYSYKGNGYVRGGIFDRTQIHQNNQVTIFRDLDHIRLNDVLIDGFPDFKEKSIFIIRKKNDFDVGRSWELELLVRRQVGPIESTFKSFYQTSTPIEAYIERPLKVDPMPLWKRVWLDKLFQIIVVVAALLFLLIILFCQDVLVKYPVILNRVRLGYLIFTGIFLGWYFLGQLSIVNVFTFIDSFFNDFHWDLFLLDPVLFILWSFVAVSLLLWGRGVYCGWLCPFGAIQTLTNEVSRKFKVKQLEIPRAIHERLWAIKYIVLIVLFGMSLESISLAEKYAEVEPFKTTVMLKFQREWGYVIYAGILIFISAFNHKFYCRYLCPLGAALSIPAKLSLFNWLRRRKECGSPCQLCSVECEIKAIHKNGEINKNECHYCLDCQVTYYKNNKCPPLISKTKKRKKNATKGIPIIEIN